MILTTDSAKLSPILLSPLQDESWPNYAADEIAAVVRCLESGKVNQWTGPTVSRFERDYENFLGAGRAIALANGSVALELALKAFGIGPGDEVVVTPRSFMASAACVALVGATPVFADVDPDSGNITPETVRSFITPRTKAIIPVHLGGWPADMAGIMQLAREHGLRVIEDCAQAHGATIAGKPVGSFGDAAAFSFCQDKIITTGGEGGLAVFQDEQAYDWAWSFKDHGKNRQRALAPADGRGFRWLHDQIGTNWRMTAMAAAIGSIQLAKLPEWQALRERNASIWATELSSCPGLRTPWPADPYRGAFYKFYAYVDAFPGDDQNEAARDAIIEAAAGSDLRVFSGSCSEIYRERAFADVQPLPLEVARRLGRTSLMFEVHPTLHEDRTAMRARAVATIVTKALA